jgi:UDP-N-acetylmuramate dehydrogenase
MKKINLGCEVRFDEPMSLHTTFRTGGPADLYAVPGTREELAAVVRFAAGEGLPVFPLGGGANILVSDRGIRGVVIDLSRFSAVSTRKAPDTDGPDSADRSGSATLFTAGAGLPVSDAAEIAAAMGLCGIENFYSMPGSVGGAVYMNARCYDRSVSDTLVSTAVMDERGEVRTEPVREGEFAYKRSPFQGKRLIVLEAVFRLTPGDPAELKKIMEGYRADREAKGHFAAPSAGSVFKNDRTFGAPTGVIIDRLGLRGISFGGAKLSDRHANIIVNAGEASSEEILRLIERLEREVFEATGFRLEREVILVGDWGHG